MTNKIINKIYATSEELKHHNSEFQEAKALANRVLDKPYIDPDGDICLLARQFLCLAKDEKWHVPETKAEKALKIVMILANTEPTGWLSKPEIHEFLKEFVETPEPQERQ